MKCGLLGRKLVHSYSPQIHAKLGDYSYELFEIEPYELEDFLKNTDYHGINVTVPYKKTVIPYLDELTPIAEKLGAVNTIIRRDGKLIGHNTDYFGFKMMLDSLSIEINGKKTLVLGSGGASNTAVAVLKDRGAEVVVISRSGENNYANLHRHSDAQFIVNTTPVGMYPNTDVSPIDLGLFPKLVGVLDVIYNPARTKLLLDAEKLGNVVSINGLLMLVAQAKEAAEQFTGTDISDGKIYTIQKQLESEMKNIVLIGMPGSGKTTIARMIAEKTGKKFIDSDDLIAKMAGKSIPEIFTQDGEEVFREWETKALAEVSKKSGLVIATGGGCITKERNYNLLHQNSEIFWIKRELSKLPTTGRPLSMTNKLEDLYKTREQLYSRFMDHEINNNTYPENAVLQIMNKLEV